MNINQDKINQLILETEDLKDLVVDKLIHPIATFLEESLKEKSSVFKRLLNDQEVKSLKKLKSNSGKNLERPRIIFLGYHKETDMLHLVLLNNKYNGICSEEIIRSFIGLVSNYLDPTNPLEISRRPFKENSIIKGLTQLSCQIQEGENRKLEPKIIFSFHAPLDLRSKNPEYFDYPLNLEKTFYIPIYEKLLIGVLILSFDLKDDNCIGTNLKEPIENFEKEHKTNFSGKYEEFIKKNKLPHERLEDETWFTSFRKAIYNEKYTSLRERIYKQSEKIQDDLNEYKIASRLNRKVGNSKNILKKFLLNRFFIYEEFLYLLDSYVVFELENFLKLEPERPAN